MKKHLLTMVGLGILATVQPGAAQEGGKQPLAVTTTERAEFAPGGTIRIDHSYGYLTVEGWDEPLVEVTITKSTGRSGEHLDQIRVVAERRSAGEFVITTSIPVRKGLIYSLLPRKLATLPPLPNARRGITTECTVHVPRESRLSIHHDNGYVWVSDVTGDIDVRSHTGDMTILLADPHQYAIDARTGLGSVTSDFPGEGKKRFLVATRFEHASEGPGRHVSLQMGRGSITIKKGPASGPFWKD